MSAEVHGEHRGVEEVDSFGKTVSLDTNLEIAVSEHDVHDLVREVQPVPSSERRQVKGGRLPSSRNQTEGRASNGMHVFLGLEEEDREEECLRHRNGCRAVQRYCIQRRAREGGAKRRP